MIRRSMLASCSRTLSLALCGALASAQTAPGDYLAVDDTPRDFTNLNAEAVRPLALSADGAELYALNTHGSQVLCFGGEPLAERARHDTPLFPVALAVMGEELLIVCEGTTCLVRMDRADGRVRGLLPLASEPGDIVVDEGRQRAFVACAGADALVEVALDSFSIRRTLQVPSKRPRFLALEPDGSVLVAPGVSGNNTGVLFDELVDFADAAVSPGGGLPDADLFRLRVGDTALRPVLRGLGSLLFAHGRNPATGEYWMLNVESRNADPERQGERALRGRFAENRLSIATLPPTSSGTRLQALDLDDVDPGERVRYQAGRSVSQPFGLAFAGDGRAFVAAPSADKVLVLEPSGARRAELVLPGGAIPLASLVDEGRAMLWVHGWGANQLYGFELHSSVVTPQTVLGLGSDPTPPSVRAGRRVFYDASFSAAGRFTCNHCHPGGGADGLLWDLSDQPLDDKGILVTQTLFGLEPKFPYHWRGERALGDFNPAFRDLLGHSAPLPTETFAALESFLFSLQPPANPNQDPTRRLVRRAGQGDPVRGQDLFADLPTDGAFTCLECHALPLGTNADVITFTFSPLAARTHLEAPALGDGSLAFKSQPLASVRLPGNLTIGLPVLGAGFGSRGGAQSLAAFVGGFPPLFEDDGIPDVQAFLEQFDQGLSPAAQMALLFETDSAAASGAAIEDVLLEQARRGWIDVVAWGRLGPAGEERPVRWLFDAARERFLPSDSTLRSLAWAEFRARHEAGDLRTIVQGLPPGNGRTFAFEREGRASPANEPLAFVVPPRLLWANARVAKFTFETSVPTEWEVRYRTLTGPTRTQRSRDRARVHTLVLQDLQPSTREVARFDYAADLTVTDARGKELGASLPRFSSGLSVALPQSRVVVVDEAAWERTDWDLRTRTLAARARFRLVSKPGAGLDLAAPQRVVIARLVADGAVHRSLAGAAPTEFTINGEPYDALSGPFLFSSLSAADGWAEFEFTAPGLAGGAELVLQVVAIPFVDRATFDPRAPDFDGFATLAWSLPETRPEARQLHLSLPRAAPRAAESGDDLR